MLYGRCQLKRRHEGYHTIEKADNGKRVKVRWDALGMMAYIEPLTTTVKPA